MIFTVDSNETAPFKMNKLHVAMCCTYSMHVEAVQVDIANGPSNGNLRECFFK